jgi:hypothetical protein
MENRFKVMRTAGIDGQTVGEFGAGGRVAHGVSVCSA